ncbi:MAG: hypothetical protein CBC35_10215 [Planctomycetes bacterium TMED75]|nr:hypothetical protein [Planctomycetaceae bacterium]OUU91131.1 MAG: hypothetical protein CBC35_10215 [Planctomycetes bacterium TMED75]
MIPKMPAREGQVGFLFIPPFRIQGMSVAGEQTVIQIPELDVNFDMGQCTRSSLTSNRVMLSHAHMDHLGGLPYWLSQRHFQKLGVGQIICHKEIADPLRKMIESWSELERQKTPFEVIPMEPGDVIPLKGSMVIKAIETMHTAPSLGFVVIERRSKLKAEFRDLPQSAIKEIRNRGEEITDIVEIPTIAYTGDTEPCEALKSPELAESKVIISECTFFSPEHRERARIGKHLHIRDFIELMEIWQAQDVVITHVSRRTSLGYANKCIDEMFKPEIRERFRFLMDHKGNRKRYEKQASAAMEKQKHLSKS